ncbi:MAG: thiamine pyrophosphate-dependent dehydrogenase E1 component subunit alpha, partial [Geminicoccaceae bacterium]|nr:thiamine pyrophosphate-dependent dehydrogenase E1 component subunit alpha [Geminicoccaceae bacterium]
MVAIRAFEEEALAAQKEGLVKGAIHPSIGQEAVAVGVCGALRRDDVLLSTHRGHGHTLAKGADPFAMMAELMGRAPGTSQGKGGSMHIADFAVGMLGANGVVAANIGIAAGAAHAIRLLGGDRIVCCIFGDGAVNRGPFLEGLNWAAVYRLPVLFVCEDNGFAATTRTRELTAGEGPLARARALGIEGETIDGNDVLAVYEVARYAVDKARAGGGPTVIECKTYRWYDHYGVGGAKIGVDGAFGLGYRSDRELRDCPDAMETVVATGPQLLNGTPGAPVHQILHIFPHTGFSDAHLSQALSEHPQVNTIVASISRVRPSSPLVEKAREMGLTFLVGNSHAVEILENGMPLAYALRALLPAVEVWLF